MSKNVLLTGAGGFLGQRVLTSLIQRGHHVIAISSKANMIYKDECQYFSVDSIDRSTLIGLLNDSDIFLNCAFPRAVDSVDLAKGMDYIDFLFSAAGSSHVGAVINISSQSLYSPTRSMPAREGDPVFLESRYSVAKYASEQLLKAHCDHIPYTNIRLASLIGPGFDQRVVNKMVHAAMEDGEISVQDPSHVFDYMDVDDAADALVAVVESNPNFWERVYNLGSHQPLSLTDIGSKISLYLKNRGLVCELTFENTSTSALSSALDSSLFESTFNWKPKHSFDASVGKIVRSFIEAKASTKKME